MSVTADPWPWLLPLLASSASCLLSAAAWARVCRLRRAWPADSLAAVQGLLLEAADLQERQRRLSSRLAVQLSRLSGSDRRRASNEPEHLPGRRPRSQDQPSSQPESSDPELGSSSPAGEQ